MSPRARMLDIGEDQKLRITYGALVAVLIAVVGFATWMTTMQINMNANAAGIEELRVEKVETQKMIMDIRDDVTELKIFFGIKKKKRRIDDE